MDCIRGTNPWEVPLLTACSVKISVDEDDKTDGASQAFDFEYDGTSSQHLFLPEAHFLERVYIPKNPCGAVLGPSGSGKTTALKRILSTWEEKSLSMGGAGKKIVSEADIPVWDEGCAVFSQFEGCASSPGFRPLFLEICVEVLGIPKKTLFRPFHVLSSSEQHFITIARLLCLSIVRAGKVCPETGEILIPEKVAAAAAPKAPKPKTGAPRKKKKKDETGVEQQSDLVWCLVDEYTSYSDRNTAARVSLTLGTFLRENGAQLGIGLIVAGLFGDVLPHLSPAWCVHSHLGLVTGATVLRGEKNLPSSKGKELFGEILVPAAASPASNRGPAAAAPPPASNGGLLPAAAPPPASNGGLPAAAAAPPPASNGGLPAAAASPASNGGPPPAAPPPASNGGPAVAASPASNGGPPPAAPPAASNAAGAPAVPKRVDDTDVVVDQDVADSGSSTAGEKNVSQENFDAFFQPPSVKIVIRRLEKEAGKEIFNRVFKNHHYLSGNLNIAQSTFCLAREEVVGGSAGGSAGIIYNRSTIPFFGFCRKAIRNDVDVHGGPRTMSSSMTSFVVWRTPLLSSSQSAMMITTEFAILRTMFFSHGPRLHSHIFSHTSLCSAQEYGRRSTTVVPKKSTIDFLNQIIVGNRSTITARPYGSSLPVGTSHKGEPVGFVCSNPVLGGSIVTHRYESRLVVLPQFQGFGLGPRISNAVASML